MLLIVKVRCRQQEEFAPRLPTKRLAQSWQAQWIISISAVAHLRNVLLLIFNAITTGLRRFAVPFFRSWYVQMCRVVSDVPCPSDSSRDLKNSRFVLWGLDIHHICLQEWFYVSIRVVLVVRCHNVRGVICEFALTDYCTVVAITFYCGVDGQVFIGRSEIH